MPGREVLRARKVVRRVARHLREEEKLDFGERMCMGARAAGPAYMRRGCGGLRPSQESDKTTFSIETSRGGIDDLWYLLGEGDR